ncbi:hypothetical protein [Desulfosediminicola sp.]|uniref:hypothetical protein n=1 Tax=Desulfosediminicola sp. TaxID=2886825 RepID=UPI003AF2B89F
MRILDTGGIKELMLGSFVAAVCFGAPALSENNRHSLKDRRDYLQIRHYNSVAPQVRYRNVSPKLCNVPVRTYIHQSKTGKTGTSIDC